MKKRNQALLCLSLAALFTLAGCGNDPTPNPSSSGPVTGQSSSNPTDSSGDQVPSKWGQETDALIEEVLGMDFDLPYCEGLTDSAAISIESDEDGDFLYISDEQASDVSAAFGEALLNAGFEDWGEDEEDSQVHFYAYYFGDLGLYVIVQVGYSSDYGMEIYLWGEPGYYQDASFPYARINDYFELEGFAEANIPTFALKAGESYFSAPSVPNAYQIKGVVDDALTTMTSYLASCKSLGYETDTPYEGDDSGSAVAKKTIDGVTWKLDLAYEIYEGEHDFRVEVNRLVPQATEWDANSVGYMKEAFGMDYTLPFPSGLTTEFESGLDQDEDGYYFYAYDESCGDLTYTYSNQLSALGYTKVDEDDDMVWYSLSFKEKNLDLIVQIQYDEDGIFYIFAWLEKESSGESSEDSSSDSGPQTGTTFPYDSVGEAFGFALDTVEKIPSFETTSGDYYVTVSEDKSMCYIGGYIDSSIEDAAMEDQYQAKLIEKGFTVSLVGQTKTAVLEEAGLKIEFWCTSSYFFLQIYNILA